jgi:hypothetical protein
VQDRLDLAGPIVLHHHSNQIPVLHCAHEETARDVMGSSCLMTFVPVWAS